MKNKRLEIHWLITLIVFVLSASTGFSQVREWTASDGRKLKAEYLGVQGKGPETRVRLMLANGTEALYPVLKLSEEDREFVKRAILAGPVNPEAREIDRLVLDKLKTSYRELQTELASLPANQNLTEADRAKREAEIEREMAMCVPNPKTTGHQFLRRIYLDIAGRIPTYDEATRFLESDSVGKRAELIDELLDSEAYGMRMFNYFSNLLRVREKLVATGSSMKADSYIEWLKRFARDNKPYDEMVREMISAEGRVWENPATGYLFTDNGNTLCNLSNTFTIFLGTEITCAQCHDHPFEEVSQMDFYKLATFMGTMTVRDLSLRIEYGEELGRMAAILGQNGTSMKKGETRGLDERKGGVIYGIRDGQKQRIALPHDYKYDDGEPLEVVEPGTYFGDEIQDKDFESPRIAFAEWMTSPENPKFTVNLVNRLWKLTMGYGQLEPLDRLPDEIERKAQNAKLLRYLEGMMQDKDYRLKDFLRVIYNTEAYQREAEVLSPTLPQIASGAYHFPGPALRRMSAEQIWDSLLTLTTDQPEAYTRKGGEDYRELMDFDTTTLKTAEEILAFANRWSRIGKITNEEGVALEMSRRKGEISLKARASELRQPAGTAHFLRVFGQSSRELIEGNYDVGSSPQILSLMNGVISNSLLTHPEGYLIADIALGEDRAGDPIDRIFLSIFCRPPSAEERTMAETMVGARDETADGIGDVVWSLVNTQEFMFLQ